MILPLMNLRRPNIDGFPTMEFLLHPADPETADTYFFLHALNKNELIVKGTFLSTCLYGNQSLRMLKK